MRSSPLTALVVAALLAGCTVTVDERGVDVRVDEPPGGSSPGVSGHADARGPPPVDGRNLTVHFIDVGQGDAVLVVTPGGRALLVDAGDRSQGGKVIAYLRGAGVERLDAFVATHPHADHIGGAGVEDPERNVLHAFPTARVYEPGYPHTTLTYETFLRTVDATGADYRDHRDFVPGDGIDIDANVTITFLHPDVVDAHGELNDQGIVLRLAYGNFSVMLPGDIGAVAERAVVARGLPVESTVLHVGHHGSRTSTSDAWLRAVAPAAAVITVGADNPYGHPHDEVVERLRARDLAVHRTDVDGSIVVTSDGVTWSVSTLG